jgi:anti-sigma-K factor RskA
MAAVPSTRRSLAKWRISVLRLEVVLTVACGVRVSLVSRQAVEPLIARGNHVAV